MKRTRRITILLLTLLATAVVYAQQPVQQSEPGLLNLNTIFSFSPKSLDAVEWQPDGSGYLALESSAGKENIVEIVRYDAATGERKIVVAADKLTPQGASSALVVEQYDFSDDGQKVLLFTNSARVWRSNTRGDYWVLDLKSWKLSKLGGDAKPSTLMFAKFSPDGTRVGYVRENNIYVESLSDSRITPLTTDGSRYINGTFDWVYEAE